MSMVLDPPILARGVFVAALCRVTIVPMRAADGVTVWAEKIPVALLLQRPGEALRCQSPVGDPLTIAQLEALDPGVVARFAEAVARGLNP